MRHHARLIPLCSLFLSLLGCESNSKAAAEVSATHPLSIALAPSYTFNDSGFAFLARPEWAVESHNRTMVIADRSDKDIKLYDSLGRRTATYGRPGHGPGEFTMLTSAEPFRDSVVAFDMLTGRATVFGPTGDYVRDVTLPGDKESRPFFMRVLDDSLWLATYAPTAPTPVGIRLFYTNGSTFSEIFDRRAYFSGSGHLMQMSAIIGDGRNGTLFLTHFGGDSLFALDYKGSVLAAGVITDSSGSPLRSFHDMASANGGRLQASDGSWLPEGRLVVNRVVALSSTTVAVSIVPFDTKNGIDPLERSEIVVLERKGSSFKQVWREHVDFGLLGRGLGVSALLIGHAPDNPDRTVVRRLSVVEAR